jgi:hypothetical protein
MNRLHKIAEDLSAVIHKETYVLSYSDCDFVAKKQIFIVEDIARQAWEASKQHPDFDEWFRSEIDKTP